MVLNFCYVYIFITIIINNFQIYSQCYSNVQNHLTRNIYIIRGLTVPTTFKVP